MSASSSSSSSSQENTSSREKWKEAECKIPYCGHSWSSQVVFLVVMFMVVLIVRNKLSNLPKYHSPQPPSWISPQKKKGEKWE